MLFRSDIDNLLYKYTNEIHANEIVLLAYYIATINIEETFHDLIGADEYAQFEGIVLTDTFAMTERQIIKDTEASEQLEKMFEENSARAEKQLKAPITVIIGNPPYSVGCVFRDCARNGTRTRTAAMAKGF